MQPKLICLTPVFNEAWILDRFLTCASLWADHIIIGDQGSTDGSVEIAKKYNKVIFIENDKNYDFDEFQMRAPLFDAARKIEGQKILISLDADEILTPNFNSLEWNTIRNSKPGTVISLHINNLLPDMTYYESGDIWCGYNDDGAPYKSGTIHSPRSIMLYGPGHDVIECHDIQILHYKCMDIVRLQERNRWYQCVELVNKINSPITIFRRYHYLKNVNKDKIRAVPDWWLTEYAKLCVEITSIIHKPEPRWNMQIISYLDKYGAKCFRHLNIWDVNWNDIANTLGVKHKNTFKDPRLKWDKAVNRWLINTQYKGHMASFRIIEKILRLIYK